MAKTYNQIGFGARGNDVRTLQEQLNAKGYKLNVDGIFGNDTLAAVKNFQQKNNLSADGIAGKNTWGKIWDGVKSVVNSLSGNKEGYQYDPFEYGAYEESDEVKAAGQAKADAEDAVANYGDFAWSDQGKYDNLIKEYENRPGFSYDFNGDAIYQQYKDKYIKQGKMAMADTIGQASAMTGGYGNSYAQTVGNQAYQAQLENLNDVIPELYSLAYEKYNQEGRDMLNMIGLMGDERAFAYGQWGDKYNQLVADRGYYGSQYDSERTWDYGKYADDRTLAHGEHTNEQGYEYNNYRDKIADSQWQANFDEAKRQFDEQMTWEKKKYNDSKVTYSSGGSSGGSSSGGSSSGSSNSGNNSSNSNNNSETKIKPTKTDNTSRFIALHQTKDEYMRRGKNFNQYKEYIESEIEKDEGSLSDEELMYLIQYYGLS